ncbi:transporter substrate-binding domain-containing protein [Pseudoroseomonas cervicalis]|uniref:transporter substrate-binding domain-containing protein n=1 Tax=Teichococcus cervicalis TaxID=204525 RepID=UPI0035ECD2E2
MLKHLLLAATAAILPLAAQAADLPSRIASRGTLIAAIVPNYPPLEMRDPQTNQLTGFDVELGNAIAERSSACACSGRRPASTRCWPRCAPAASTSSSPACPT